MDSEKSVKSLSDEELVEESILQEQTEAKEERGENRNQISRKITELPEKLEEKIKEGDLCIAFFTPFHQKLFNVENSGLYDTKYGHYNYAEMIGKPFGSMVDEFVSCLIPQIRSKCGHKYFYLLKPSRTTFTNNLQHRTQILYHMDIGSVINHLDIKFGDKVVETGTGSGSLTFSLSQQVGSQGKVFTFEFNKQR